MLATVLRATAGFDRSNKKFVTVNLVLILMVTMPSLPLDSRSAYSYVSKITILLVHSS